MTDSSIARITGMFGVACVLLSLGLIRFSGRFR
jgi:hypothetical protein